MLYAKSLKLEIKRKYHSVSAPGWSKNPAERAVLSLAPACNGTLHAAENPGNGDAMGSCDQVGTDTDGV